MKKFIVETYYTCTFKTVHALDELNEKELSKIDQRKDGEVEVIEVKLNNRKTKRTGERDKNPVKQNNKINKVSKTVSDQIFNKNTNNSINPVLNNKIINARCSVQIFFTGFCAANVFRTTCTRISLRENVVKL